MVVGSSALVASSINSTWGRVASARAMPTRCFCPPESCEGWAWALSGSPTRSSSSVTRGAMSCFFSPASSRPKATLSKTVRLASRLKCWKMVPIWRRTERNSLPCSEVQSVPATRMVPLVTSSRWFRQRSSVVLPAPERPKMP